MINSISNMNSAMSIMDSASMGRRQPPPGKDVFQVADANSDGQVSKTELKTLATGLEQITGNSIDPEDALNSFDTDQDGALSGEELQGLMSSLGFTPPGMSCNENGQAEGMRPPPPSPSSEKAMSAYAENTGEDKIEQLIALLKEQNGDDLEISSIDVTC